jgi:hypothetical protein
MDKQTIYKFIAILAAGGALLLGDVLLFGSFGQSSQQATSQYMIGVLDAKYEISSFKGIAKILNPENFSAIRGNITGMPGVKKVYESPDEILITTENESVSMEIYKLVDGKYGSVLSKAVLVPEGTGTLNGTYQVNVSLPLEVYIKPAIGTGGMVDMRADALVQDGSVTYMQNVAIMSERKRIDVSGNITGFSGKEYVYEVDFSDRGMITDALNATTEISDIVLLNSTPKIRKDYVLYAGDGYIQVNRTMADKGAIIQDYGNATFPGSFIRSEVPLNISFASGAKEESVAMVDMSRAQYYHMPETSIAVTVEGAQNATGVALVLNAEVSGNVVLDYTVVGSQPLYS